MLLFAPPSSPPCRKYFLKSPPFKYSDCFSTKVVETLFIYVAGVSSAILLKVDVTTLVKPTDVAG